MDDRTGSRFANADGVTSVLALTLALCGGWGLGCSLSSTWGTVLATSSLTLWGLLLQCARPATPIRAGVLSFVFFAACYVRAFGSLAATVAERLVEAPWGGAATLIALGVYCATWPAVAVGAASAAARGLGPLSRIVLLVCAVTLADYGRAELIAPLPWALLAYGATDPWLLWSAPWGGVWLADALLLCAALVAAAGLLCRRSRAVTLAALVMVVLLRLSWPAAGPEGPGPTLPVTAIPWGTEVADKYDPRQLGARVRSLQRFAAEASGRVVVFPETALSFPWERLPASARSEFQAIADAPPGRILLLGAFRQEPGRSFNSALLLAPQAPVRFLDKQLLMPFGEFWPAPLRWLRPPQRLPMQDLTAGAGAPLAWPAEAPAVLICNEVNSPKLAARRLADARWAALISDLSWFTGHEVADHELRAARWRAAENARALLLVRADAQTLVITPRGGIGAIAPRGLHRWQTAMPLRDHRTWFSRAPAAVPVLLAVLLTILCCGSWIRRRRSAAAC
jgi:apolipoprotein N-acyltransferase